MAGHPEPGAALAHSSRPAPAGRRRVAAQVQGDLVQAGGLVVRGLRRAGRRRRGERPGGTGVRRTGELVVLDQLGGVRVARALVPGRSSAGRAARGSSPDRGGPRPVQGSRTRACANRYGPARTSSTRPTSRRLEQVERLLGPHLGGVATTATSKLRPPPPRWPAPAWLPGSAAPSRWRTTSRTPVGTRTTGGGGLVREHALAGQQPDQLADEERVAVGALGDRCGHGVVDVHPGAVTDVGGDVVRAEPVERGCAAGRCEPGQPGSGRAAGRSRPRRCGWSRPPPPGRRPAVPRTRRSRRRLSGSAQCRSSSTIRLPVPPVASSRAATESGEPERGRLAVERRLGPADRSGSRTPSSASAVTHGRRAGVPSSASTLPTRSASRRRSRGRRPPPPGGSCRSPARR